MRRGWGLLALLGTMAGLGLWLDPAPLDIGHRLAPPSLTHWFGTDALGRDMLRRVVQGAAPALGVALMAVALGASVGVPLGLLAATPGVAARRWGAGIMRANDVLFAFPALLLAILFMATLGPGLMTAALAVGLVSIPVFTRITRAAALPIWGMDYVAAGRLCGKGWTRLALAHVWPNIRPLVQTQMLIQFTFGVLAEAGLSYIGLSAAPPIVSWGRLLYEAQTYVTLAPWLAIFPGLAIFLTVLSLDRLAQGGGR